MSVKILFFVFMLLVPSHVKGGEAGDYEPSKVEDSLKILFQTLAVTDKPGERERINNKIITILSKTLRLEESFHYPFDSLSSLGKITASDDMLRIYTWNFPVSPINYKYYGFLQYRGNDSGEVSLHFLNPAETSREDLEQEQFSAENWYGALYYQVHAVNYLDDTIYTLMGFDFNHVYTSIKIIDVLSFNDGLPVFGAPIFQFGRVIKNRVVFEYSSRAVMFMRYVPERDMIIYDHLSPSSPRFEGQYRYYGPDFSYDGFRFDNGKWIHVPDIEWK